MAEDCLIGFKFNDREDNLKEDLAIRDVSDMLFQEIAVDHLGGKAALAETDVADVGPELEGFDFTEAFDFSF